MAAGAEGPDPSCAATPEEYVAALRALKDWSGLTYRQLSARAEAVGDVLPHSTLAGSLARTTLPRRDVVAALVRACGCGDAATDAWLSAHHRLAVGEAVEQHAGTVPDVPDAPVGEDAPAGEDADAGPDGVGGGRLGRYRSGSRRWTAVLVGLAAVVGSGLVIAFTLADTGGREPSGEFPDRPPVGDVRIRAAHTGMCVTEGRERNGRTDRPLAVQRDCDAVEGRPPRVALEAMGSGVHRIVWVHPVHGPGCLQVDDAGVQDGQLVAPRECDDKAPHQKFLFDPADGPEPRGFRVRAAHSGKCLGFVDPMTEEGAELVQTTCVGTADQQFLVEPD